MIVSGVCFGAWPIALNRSGLSGIGSILLVSATALGVLAVYVLVERATALESARLLQVTIAVFALNIVLLLAIGSADVTYITDGTLTHYAWIIGAGLCTGLGLIIFVNGIASLMPQTIGPPFLVMLIAQAAVPMVYHVAMNGSITPREALFGLAVLAALLLQPQYSA